ncbi:MAG: hypothetical protein ACLGIA_00165 [Actinomycetes bacterium]
MTSSTPRPEALPRWAPLVLAALAAVAHLVIGFFYLASGLMAPLWAIVVLLVCWLALAFWLARLALASSWWTPAPPVVAVVLWFGALTAGERLLGWTP